VRLYDLLPEYIPAGALGHLSSINAVHFLDFGATDEDDYMPLWTRVIHDLPVKQITHLTLDNIRYYYGSLPDAISAFEVLESLSLQEIYIWLPNTNWEAEWQNRCIPSRLHTLDTFILNGGHSSFYDWLNQHMPLPQIHHLTVQEISTKDIQEIDEFIRLSGAALTVLRISFLMSYRRQPPSM
jgi:hypothetical protein